MAVAGRFFRGWATAKQSWHVTATHPSLVVFPVLSAVFATIAVVVILTPATLALAVTGNANDVELRVASWAYVVILLLIGYICTVISVFFNVALVAAGSVALRGESIDVCGAVGVAWSRRGAILGWSLLATGVGSLLTTLSKATGAGSFLGWVGDVAWSVATFFVIPVIALEGGDAKHAVKRSAAVVKERWGEGATGAGAIGALGLAILVVIFLLGVAGYSVLAGLNMAGVAIAFGILCALALMVVLLSSLALSAVFKVALYQYVEDGAVPEGFDAEALEGAFGRNA